MLKGAECKNIHLALPFLGVVLDTSVDAEIKIKIQRSLLITLNSTNVFVNRFSHHNTINKNLNDFRLRKICFNKKEKLTFCLYQDAKIATSNWHALIRLESYIRDLESTKNLSEAWYKRLERFIIHEKFKLPTEKSWFAIAETLAKAGFERAQKEEIETSNIGCSKSDASIYKMWQNCSCQFRKPKPILHLQEAKLQRVDIVKE